MKALKIALATVLALASLSLPGSAKSVWDQINETAPLQPVFQELERNAP